MKEEVRSIRIRGQNFEGEAVWKSEKLELELSQLKHGQFYTFETNNSIISSERRQYLIFQNVEDLFLQLSINHETCIDEKGRLNIPISIEFRGSKKFLTIQLRLAEVILSVQDKISKLCEQLTKMHKLNRKVEQEFNEYKLSMLGKSIEFIPNELDQNMEFFQFNANHRQIKYVKHVAGAGIANNAFLPKKNKHYFSIKINASKKNFISLGICSNQTRDIKGNEFNSGSDIVLAELDTGRIVVGNNEMKKGKLQIKPESIVTVSIDPLKQLISWFIDSTCFNSIGIPQKMLSCEWKFIVFFYDQGDSISLL